MRDNTAQHYVKTLMMMNVHGNVIIILNINKSKANIHNADSLRLIIRESH